MPTPEIIKNFLVGVVLPIGVGALTTFIVGNVHVLNLFHISEKQIAGELTLLGTWAISTVIVALHQHHALLARSTQYGRSGGCSS